MASLRLVLPLLAAALVLVAAWPAMVSADNQATERARRFVQAYTAKIRPLEIAANRAWWNANLSGKDEDYKAKEDAQNKIDAALSSKDDFKEVKAIKEGGKIDDPVLARAMDVIYLAYLEK